MTLKITGFLVSALLTILAYLLILNPQPFGAQRATVGILLLAGLQSLVQLICFINLWKEKGPLWNLVVFASTVVIIAIVIYFSIWIMDHLNHNMMY